MVRTLVYAPEGTASATAKPCPYPTCRKCGWGVRGVADNADKAKQGDTVKGFVAGAACTAVIASALWWWQAYPMQQQLTGQGYHTGSRHRLVGLPVLKEYEQYLQQLLNAPPLQPLETGMQMMRTADTLWPESLQQQEASRMWSNTLKPGASQSADEGLATSAAEFAGFCRFDDEEGDGETRFHPIVYQNGDWQAERLLNQETPLEYLLTQYRRPVHRSRTHRRWKRDQRTAGRAVKPLAAAEKYRTGYGNG